MKTRVFLKKQIEQGFAIIMCMVVLLPAVAFAAPIPVESQTSGWAEELVDAAIAAELVPEALQMRYTEPITREEFCILVVRFVEVACNTTIGGRVRFVDTNNPDIEMAAWMGIVQGVGEDRFAPNEFVTRELAATMLVRLSIAVDHPLPRAIATFTDNSAVAKWAFASVGRVREAGVMYGIDDLRFDPAGLCTREQSIAAVLQMYKLVTETPVSIPSQTFNHAGHLYDMSDPNVQKFPELTTSRPDSLSEAWRSAEEVRSFLKQDGLNQLTNGKTLYERCMRPIEEWVDKYMATHGLSVEGKSDYEKTEIIKAITADASTMEELIQFWEPDFHFSTGDCVVRANAVQFLMVALDFERFRIAVVQFRPDLTHATNAYWDASSGAIRFIDDPGNGWGVWNLFLDELDENSGAILI